MAFVTIGIPFYNAEKTLADAIRSVFAQTYTDWELILVDDGSTDRSLEIARSVNDPRVRVISDGKNLKLAARLNQIVREAQYDYIARMDADDLMSPDRIEKEMSLFEQYPDVDLVSTGICSITNDDVPTGIRIHNSNYISSSEVFTHRGGAGIVHASVVAKKDWYKRNCYNTAYKTSQDADLWLNAFLHNDLSHYIIREPLYYYRETGNVTAPKILSGTINLLKMFFHYKGLLKWVDKIDVFLLLLFKLCVIFILNCTGQTKRLLFIRNTTISEYKQWQHSTEIQKIKNIKIPGLSIDK